LRYAEQVIEASQLLAAYDRHLRCEAEMQGAASVERRGPLWLAVFGEEDEPRTGFVSYGSLAGVEVEAAAASLADWVGAHPELSEVEVKTRAHDVAPGWHDALLGLGFRPEETESVMVGPVDGLLADAPEPPEKVRLLPALTREQMYAAARMEDAVFGSELAERIVPELLRRRAAGDPVTLWFAEADGRVISAGRIDPVAGTPFAGVWGGATLPEYRGRGIYRALTAARAASVLELGVRYIHSDSTEHSRPILERAGLVKVTETTPYVLHR